MTKRIEWMGSAAESGASEDGGTTIRLGVCLGKSEQLTMLPCRAMRSPPEVCFASKSAACEARSAVVLLKDFLQQSPSSVAQDS
jgi:hypothetical protein